MEETEWRAQDSSCHLGQCTTQSLHTDSGTFHRVLWAAGGTKGDCNVNKGSGWSHNALHPAWHPALHVWLHRHPGLEGSSSVCPCVHKSQVTLHP